jgi:putative membrane protein insertion efficiency factor
MSIVRQQAASGQRPLSSLRQCLKKPHFWWCVLLLLLGAGIADAWREPSDQIGARIYVRLVRLYQSQGSPRLAGYVRCRFVPTCSEYSIQVVQARGLVTGLVMTAERISRCRKNVPPGTLDDPRQSAARRAN